MTAELSQMTTHMAPHRKVEISHWQSRVNGTSDHFHLWWIVLFGKGENGPKHCCMWGLSLTSWFVAIPLPNLANSRLENGAMNEPSRRAYRDSLNNKRIMN